MGAEGQEEAELFLSLVKKKRGGGDDSWGRGSKETFVFRYVSL